MLPKWWYQSLKILLSSFYYHWTVSVSYEVLIILQLAKIKTHSTSHLNKPLNMIRVRPTDPGLWACSRWSNHQRWTIRATLIIDDPELAPVLSGTDLPTSEGWKAKLPYQRKENGRSAAGIAILPDPKIVYRNIWPGNTYYNFRYSANMLNISLRKFDLAQYYLIYGRTCYIVIKIYRNLHPHIRVICQGFRVITPFTLWDICTAL